MIDFTGAIQGWVEFATGDHDVPLRTVHASTLDTALPRPVHVDPQTSVPLDLAFSWFPHEAPKFAPLPALQPEEWSPFNDADKIRLDITDAISGQTIGLRIPGVYETREARRSP